MMSIIEIHNFYVIFSSYMYLMYVQIDVQDDKEKKTAIIVGNAGPISLENIELDLGFRIYCLFCHFSIINSLAQR